MNSSQKYPSADVQAIDDLFANVGLSHGRRRLMAKGFERQAKHPGQQKAVSRPSSAAARATAPVIAHVPGWSRMKWLLHGFSTRIGGHSTVYGTAKEAGELNLGFTPADSRKAVENNRQALLRAIAGDDDSHIKLHAMKQVHSSLVHRLPDARLPAKGLLIGDGMMTGEPGILLAIQTADCIPVLVADKRNRAVGAFHAGWRGTLKRIVEAGVGRMRLEFGSRPEDMIAAIGPGIGQCCYAVGEEVRDQFESQFAYAPELFRDVYDSDPVKEKYPLLFMTARAPGHSNIGPSMHLDLAGANRRQLVAAGLAPEAIFVSGECTSCRTDRYFSHRAEAGFTGRMMSVIGLR